jgi:hypothetical protein
MQSARTAILACLLVVPALAGSSTDYSLVPAVLDGGGTAGSSADYALNASMSPGAAGASANYELRGGYAGQLMDLTDIVIDEPSALMLNEGATLQLVVVATYDDASQAVLSAGDLFWSVQSGPIAGVDSSGLVTAGSVYQNTQAVARAASGGVSDTVDITVRNTGLDDFGPYAADGLPDTWQVQYFGPSGTLGASSADYDSDGLTNLQEFAFGTDPSQASGGAVQWNGSTLLAAGQPVPYATTGLTGFTFRAVYSRRKDFITAGLSYTVEFSADLATWKSSTATPSVLADDGEIQVVSVPYPFFVSGKKATFFRVKVQVPSL